MKLREERWLGERLQAWKEKRLLTGKQVEAIQAFEAEQRRKTRVDPLWILLGFAGLCLILGISLIIAHNWDKIPTLQREAGYVVLLAAIGLAYLRWQDTPWAHLFGIMWLVAPLAGIGLWAQIYQLSGDPFRPFLVTWLMGLPIVLVSRSGWLAVAHQVILGWGLFVGVHEINSWVGLGDWSDKIGDRGLLLQHLGLGLLLWAALLRLLQSFAPNAARWVAWVAFLYFLFLVGTSSSFNAEDGAAGMVLFSALTLLVWTGTRVGVALDSLEAPAAWFGALALYVQTFVLKEADSYYRNGPGLEGIVFLNVLAALSLLGLALAPLTELGMKPRQAWILKAALFLPLANALLGSYEDLRAIALFGANLCLAAVAVAWMLNGVERNLPKLINRGVIFLAALILTRFVDLFDSLLDSGLAFILSGLGLAAFAWILERGRRRLLKLARRARA